MNDNQDRSRRRRGAILRGHSSLSPVVPFAAVEENGLPYEIASRIFSPRDLPQVPANAMQRASQLTRRLARWDRDQALGLLAGLQLEPRYHANYVRLTWATRLVLGLASGTQRVGRSDLMRLLNTDLDKADVLRMEDPIEDFFLSPIATRWGEIPIFMGTWSHPAFYADSLVDAFTRIAGAEDASVLRSIEALLMLSRVVADRAGLDRRIAGDGRPNTTMALPPDGILARIAGHVRWTPAALEAAGIGGDALLPFVLDEADAAATLRAKPANAPVDFRPLLRTGSDLLLVAPSAISMAVRAIIADHALATNRDARLSEALLEVHAERLSETPFARMDKVPTHWGLGEPIRSELIEYSAGRFLHLEQIAGGFANWREYGFGEPSPASAVRGAQIIAAMRLSQEAAQKQLGFQFGATLYLMGGWGKGERIDFARPDPLKYWRFMALEVVDAIALSACSDGTLADFWRIHVLADMVRRQGYGLHNVSGPLNLFQWWRDTDHTLVPQQERELNPPIEISMPTDSLFTVRKEGAEAYDRRAVPSPNGGFRPVVRLDPQATFGMHEPIYVSVEVLRERRLLGVTLAGTRPGWLEVPRPEEPSELSITYQNWAAALQWLNLVMPLLPEHDTSPMPVLVTLELSSTAELDGEIPGDDALDADIMVDAVEGHVTVRVGKVWQRGVRRIDNRAELGLGAAMLEGLYAAIGRSIGREEALARVLEAVPSPDVRWRHAYQPERAADVLRLHGILQQKFREIAPSAASLIKHGHAFASNRPPNTRILGKESCATLLAELHDSSLETLLTNVAQYDRSELVTKALGMLQAALAQDQHWALTARALRGIHGLDADLLVSLAQRSRVNAVIRASSILAEVAASHAPIEDGKPVGEMDFDELAAMALHHFGYCELVPSLAGDRLTPKLIISPTGDLLYDHSFGDDTLAPSAAAMHAEVRARNVEEYGWWLGRTPGAPSRLEAELQAALQAEYGVTSEMFGAFDRTLCGLAIAADKDVILLPRSELLARLRENPEIDAAALTQLIDRLTLPCRAGWADLPEGSHSNDFDLGRFDRPLSLIARPLLAIEQGFDPMLAVGPAVVERSFMHGLGGAMNGSLQDRFWASKRMRSYVGGAANRAGMAFNDAIADDLRALGLDANASIAPWACLNHQATPAVKLLGDIDVLALSPNHRHAWVIEAKDIKLCRTLGETARRLSDYRGQQRQDGKPDHLLRHLDRVGYVRAHAADLAKRLKLETVPEIHGLVVVDTPQPMIFVEANPSPDARFVRRRDLATVDWTPVIPTGTRAAARTR